jgi:hypothetical protein
MSRGERKLEEGAQRYLAEGERIEVIQPVRAKGALNAAAFGGAVGTVAGASGSKAERAAAAEVGVKLGSFMALAITNDRLLLFAVGGVASVKELLAELPLPEVESIEVERAMLGARKRITIATGGGSFVLETQGRAKPELFTGALRRLRVAPAS